MTARTDSMLAAAAGQRFRSARLTIGVTQRELERRTGLPQSALSRFERGLPSSIDLAAIEILAKQLGGRVEVRLEVPFLHHRARQRDSLHARCVGYVSRHLIAAGWQVATEVEIDGRFGPGWIDVLAFDPRSRTVLVIEVKTEVHDVGQVQRTLGWYASRARAAAVARGWSPLRIKPALLVLATEVADRRLVANKDLADVAFPMRAVGLAALITDAALAAAGGGWGLAMVDPHSRQRAWLRPMRLDGRRRSNPYLDYADAVRVLEARRPRRRRRDARAHQLSNE